MNVDQVLQQFRAGDDFPGDAMRWALDHWETAAPRFVSRLRAFAAGSDRSEAAEDEIFFILHLCGEKGETRACEPLCRMIAEDPSLEEWLGDATTETLPGILIKVFDGDISPLTRAIEAPRGDEFARASALAAFGYLVRAKGVLSDEEMRVYLRRLRREASPREKSVFWIAWVQIASALGYGDLQIDVAMLTKDGFVDPGDFSLEDFDRNIGFAHEGSDGLAGFRNERIGPLDDAVGTLEILEPARGGCRRGRVRRGGGVRQFRPRSAPRQPVPQCRPQRPVPLRQRQEIQEMLSRRSGFPRVRRMSLMDHKPDLG